MNHDNYDDDYIRGILSSVKVIAMVGASPIDVRPSYFAFKYLVQRGYDMIPVNPGHVGKSLLGRPFVASLAEIGRPLDMIDIFRSSQHIMPVVDEALKLQPLPKVIWMRSEEHTSELQSQFHLVCRLLLEKKKKNKS